MEDNNQDDNDLELKSFFGGKTDSENSTGDKSSRNDSNTSNIGDKKSKLADIVFGYIKDSTSSIGDKITERKKAEEEIHKVSPFGDTLVEKKYKQLLGSGSKVKNIIGATKDFAIDEAQKVGRKIGSKIEKRKQATTKILSEKAQPFKQSYNLNKQKVNANINQLKQKFKENPKVNKISSEIQGLKRIGGNLIGKASAFKQNIGSKISTSKSWLGEQREGSKRIGQQLKSSTIGRASKAYENSRFIKPAVGILGKGARVIGNTAKGIYKFADKAAKVARAFTHTNDIFHTGSALSHIFGGHGEHSGLGATSKESPGSLYSAGGRDQLSTLMQGGNISDSIEGSSGSSGNIGSGGTGGSGGSGDRSVINIMNKMYQLLSLNTNFLGKIDRNVTMISKLIRDNQVIMSTMVANNKARMNENGSGVLTGSTIQTAQPKHTEDYHGIFQKVYDVLGEIAENTANNGGTGGGSIIDDIMSDGDTPDSKQTKKDKKTPKKSKKTKTTRKPGSKSKFTKALSSTKSIAEKGVGALGKAVTVGKGLVKGAGYLGAAIAGVDAASKLAEGDIKGATESGAEAIAATYAPLIYGGIKIASTGIEYAKDKTFGEGGASVINDLHKKGIIDYNFGNSKILKWDEVEKLPVDTIKKMIASDEFSQEDVKRLNQIIENQSPKAEVKSKDNTFKTLEPTMVPVSGTKETNPNLTKAQKEYQQYDKVEKEHQEKLNKFKEENVGLKTGEDKLWQNVYSDKDKQEEYNKLNRSIKEAKENKLRVRTDTEKFLDNTQSHDIDFGDDTESMITSLQSRYGYSDEELQKLGGGATEANSSTITKDGKSSAYNPEAISKLYHDKVEKQLLGEEPNLQKRNASPIEAQKVTEMVVGRQEVPSTLDKAKTIGKSLLSSSPLVGVATAVNTLIPKDGKSSAYNPEAISKLYHDKVEKQLLGEEPNLQKRNASPIEAQKVVTPIEGTITPIEAQKVTEMVVGRQEVPSTLDKAKTIGKSLLSSSPLVGVATAVNTLIPKEKEQILTETPIEQPKPEIYNTKNKNQYQYENALLSSLFGIPTTNDEDVVKKPQGSIQNKSLVEDMLPGAVRLDESIDTSNSALVDKMLPGSERLDESGNLTSSLDYDTDDQTDKEFGNVNIQKLTIKELKIENAREATPMLGGQGGGAPSLLDKAKSFFGFGPSEKEGEGPTATPEKGRKGPAKEFEMPEDKVFGIAGHFESGNRADMISSGAGDHGGKSYGEFQLAGRGGKAGNEVDQFLKSSGYDKQFEGLQVGSAEFDQKWKEVAKNDPKFSQAQKETAKKKFFDPQMAKMEEAGMDVSKLSDTQKAAVFSTANQYGANTNTIKKAFAGKDTSKMSETEWLNTLQDYKQEHVSENFKSSRADVQAGVSNRIEKERKMLLAQSEADKLNPKVSDTQLAANTPETAKSQQEGTKQTEPTQVAEVLQKTQSSGLEPKKIDNGTATYIQPKQPTATLVSENTQNEPLLNQTMKTSTPVREKPSEMAGLETSMNKVGAAVAQSSQAQVNVGGDQGGNNPQGFGKVPFNVRNDDPLLLTLQYGNLRTV